MNLTPGQPRPTVLEAKTNYSIVLNLVNAAQDVGVDVNVVKREITVLAKKSDSYVRTGLFWTFGVPSDAHMADTTARYRCGILEIKIPREMSR